MNSTSAVAVSIQAVSPELSSSWAKATPGRKGEQRCAGKIV